MSSLEPIDEPHLQPAPQTPEEKSGQAPAWLRTQTLARIGLRRTGVSLATPELLDFQLAHARARDAVHAPLQPATLLPALQQLGLTQSPLLLHSQAQDRQHYLQRPDLGRQLDAASRQLLAARDPRSHDLAIILADGLSALAVERHAIPLLAQLLPALGQISLAPITLVQQARVAIGDQIANILHARLAIVLIGERPGLSSPDSLGAYITWNPQPGVTADAHRNCISNIRSEGLGYTQAAARLLYYIVEAHSQGATGIQLKDPAPHQLPKLTATVPAISPQSAKPAEQPA